VSWWKGQGESRGWGSQQAKLDLNNVKLRESMSFGRSHSPKTNRALRKKITNEENLVREPREVERVL
jgi:hypothetical protein